MKLRFKKTISKLSFCSVAFVALCFTKLKIFSHLLTSTSYFLLKNKDLLTLLPVEQNLSICKEKIMLVFITISVFLSHQVPKTERKKRRKKETDLVSYDLFFMLNKMIFRPAVSSISYCISVNIFKEYVYLIPNLYAFTKI